MDSFVIKLKKDDSRDRSENSVAPAHRDCAKNNISHLKLSFQDKLKNLPINLRRTFKTNNQSTHQ